MAVEDHDRTPLAKALKRQKELQDTIKAATETIKVAMREIEKLKQFIGLYRSFTVDTDSEVTEGKVLPLFQVPQHVPFSTKFKGRAHGQTQEVFQALALDILRDVGRPMKSTEFIEEFRKRGQPLGGNEVRTAWNRLWKAKSNGLLTYDVKLGYWIPGEPLTEEMKAVAVAAGKRHRGKAPSLRDTKGKPKGPPPALTPEQVKEAERLLLSGKTRTEVCELFGGISMATLANYVGRTDDFLARHPGVVIPKPTPRPPHYKPGWKPPGRPRTLTPEQNREIADMRARGKSIEEISEIMGVKRTSVYAAIRRATEAGTNSENSN